MIGTLTLSEPPQARLWGTSCGVECASRWLLSLYDMDNHGITRLMLLAVRLSNPVAVGSISESKEVRDTHGE